MDRSKRIYITHKNARYWREQVLAAAPWLQCGSKVPANPNSWIYSQCILELPMGEIADGGLKYIALVGRNPYELKDLSGKEGFIAQGLEGKISITKPLFDAVMNLDIVPEYRARIIWDTPITYAGEKGGRL